MEGEKALARGTFWNMLGQVAVKGSAFFYSILIANFISQQDVGDFYLALSLMSILVFFAHFGLNGAVGRYVAYFRGEGDSKKLAMLTNYGLLIVAAFSLAVSLTVFFSSESIASLFSNDRLVELVKITAFYIFFVETMEFCTGVLMGMNKMKQYSFVMALRDILKLLVTAAFIFTFGFNAAQLSYSYVVSFALAALVAYFLMAGERRKLPKPESKAVVSDHLSLWSEVVPFGITVSIIGSFWMFLTYLDRLLLGYLLPSSAASADIAIYSMAVGLSSVIFIFSSSMAVSFLPIVSELAGKKETGKMRETASTGIKWMLFLAIPATIAVISFPDMLLGLLYGSEYERGALALALLSIGFLIRSVTMLHDSLFASIRRLDVQVGIAVSAVALNLALNWMLIPVYGINGSALACMISFLFVSVLFVYYAKRIMGVGLPTSLPKIVLSALLALLLIFLLRPYLIPFAYSSIDYLNGAFSGAILSKFIKLAVFVLISIFSFASFIIFIFLLKCYDEKDVKMLEAGLRKLQIPEAIIRKIADVL